jgi:cytochrome P450
VDDRVRTTPDVTSLLTHGLEAHNRPMATSQTTVSPPPSLPVDFIGGHFRSFRKAPTEFLARLSKLGDVTAFRMGPQRGYFINNPEYIRDLLVVNAHKFIKGRALQRAKTLLGNGLLTSEGEFHLRQRRMMQPAFHRSRIAEYARSMVEYGERLSNEWKDGEIRDIDKEMMRLTLQIVAKTLFSADVTDEADDVGQAMTTLVKMFDYLLLPFSEWLEKLPLPQSRRLHRARSTLNSIIFHFMEERRRSGEDKGDLLSMLLAARDEDDSTMSDDQIRDEALTLFLAGHETTANALTWTWYLLSQNPGSETTLYDELDRVFDASRPPSFDDLPHLKYTEAVIAESMRLFPPAWAIGRLAVEPHQFGPYSVEKSSLVLVSQHTTHRDPRFWNEPETFKPERWIDVSIKEAGQQFIYFPFGGGVRRCIGESFAWIEGILLLATLARKWRFRMVPEQKIGLQPMITLRPKFGMKMKIQERG